LIALALSKERKLLLPSGFLYISMSVSSSNISLKQLLQKLCYGIICKYSSR